MSKNVDVFFSVVVVILSVLVISGIMGFTYRPVGFFAPWWLYAWLMLIISETLFWFVTDNKPKKGQSKIAFTIGEKLWCLLAAGFIVVALQGIANMVYWTGPWIAENQETFVAGSVTTIATVGIIAFYLWINSLKYRKRGKK